MDIQERLKQLEGEEAQATQALQALYAEANEIGQQIQQKAAALSTSIHRIQGAKTLLREMGATPSAPAPVARLGEPVQ